MSIGLEECMLLHAFDIRMPKLQAVSTLNDFRKLCFLWTRFLGAICESLEKY